MQGMSTGELDANARLRSPGVATELVPLHRAVVSFWYCQRPEVAEGEVLPWRLGHRLHLNEVAFGVLGYWRSGTDADTTALYYCRVVVGWTAEQ